MNKKRVRIKTWMVTYKQIIRKKIFQITYMYKFG